MASIKLTEHFDVYLYFYKGHRSRLIIIAVLLGLILLSLLLAFNGVWMPFSSVTVMICAILLVGFLLLDSGYYVLSLLMSSLQRKIMIIRTVDPELRVAIERAEEEASATPSEERELKSMAKEFLSDFGNRRPLPMLAKALLWRTIPNFWITVFCFASISMGMSLMHHYKTLQPPYGHNCLNFGGFISILIHFLYYHVVIFQSLGDGSHSPTTVLSQAIATVETCISYFYLIFIFGGLLSTAMFVQSEMTPEKLCDELYERLNSLTPKGTAGGAGG